MLQDIDKSKIKLLCLDFDGVFTDNTVIIDNSGNKSVVCSYYDSMGLNILREGRPDIQIVVISTEKADYVPQRCKQLGITCFRGIEYKLTILEKLMKDKNLDRDQVVFVGNDINDIDCIHHAGVSIAPRNSFKDVIEACDYYTCHVGGRGAIRDVCEWFLCSRMVEVNFLYPVAHTEYNSGYLDEDSLEPYGI